MFDPNQSLKLTTQQVATSLNGETVILNTNKGFYYSLNEVGSLVWNHLENNSKASFEALSKLILENFEIDEATCNSDLTNLLTDLINENLVEKVD